MQQNKEMDVINMTPYEFNAINKDDMKRWLKQNITNNYLCIALESIVDEMECKVARTSIHGHWIENTEETFTPSVKCSYCGYVIHEVAGENVQQPARNYCPFCGAKMDLEVD